MDRVFGELHEGPTEAYVMPFNGGVPRRLTWFGARADVAGWTPRGEVLVATRYFHPLGRTQLVAVSRDGETQNVIPLETAESAAWVLYKLDGGIDHILIDEAQDTSPEQWAMVRALATTCAA